MSGYAMAPKVTRRPAAKAKAKAKAALPPMSEELTLAENFLDAREICQQLKAAFVITPENTFEMLYLVPNVANLGRLQAAVGREWRPEMGPPVFPAWDARVLRSRGSLSFKPGARARPSSHTTFSTSVSKRAAARSRNC